MYFSQNIMKKTCQLKLTKNGGLVKYENSTSWMSKVNDICKSDKKCTISHGRGTGALSKIT